MTNPAAQEAREFLLDLINSETVLNTEADVHAMSDATAIRTSIANGYNPMDDGFTNTEVKVSA